jgi:hypothetical protein
MPASFPVCPRAPAGQIRHVPRLSPALAFFLGAAASALGGGDDMARFSEVSIKPATAFIYVATVTLTIQPFVRHKAIYSSTYSARVFPYFYTEKGRIWINVPDDALHRVANGEAIDFTGRAVNDSGDERRVAGRAVPTGVSLGTIQVRVFVTRRISINCDTTYEFVGPADPPSPVTPR